MRNGTRHSTFKLPPDSPSYFGQPAPKKHRHEQVADHGNHLIPRSSVLGDMENSRDAIEENARDHSRKDEGWAYTSRLSFPIYQIGGGLL